MKAFSQIAEMSAKDKKWTKKLYKVVVIVICDTVHRISLYEQAGKSILQEVKEKGKGWGGEGK